MINVGILGAANPVAGELIRILINHPDVELQSVVEPTLDQHSVSTVHHGLIGETDLVFTNDADLASLDVLYVCLNIESAKEFYSSYSVNENQYIIDLSGVHRVDCINNNFCCGLSEINRKTLVRDCNMAYVPSAVAAATLISCNPLMMRELVNHDLQVVVSGGYDIFEGVDTEIETQLRKINPSFAGKVSINYVDSECRRGIRIKTYVHCDMSIDNLVSLYKQVYDDHNLTFIVDGPLDFKEVEGSDKCFISLRRMENGEIEIDTIVDAKLRGGAGDAIHVMNLLCGLHEKIGLTLKVVSF